jgi:hypothetical protein
MHLFGCKFFIIKADGSKIFERKNFDSFLWATITVFQVCLLIIFNVLINQLMQNDFKDHYTRCLE